MHTILMMHPGTDTVIVILGLYTMD